MEFETTTCPKVIDENENQCGLPAEIVQRYDLADSEGLPMSHVVTLCINRHGFHGPESMLPQTTPTFEATED